MPLGTTVLKKRAEEEQHELEMNEASFDISPNSLILSNSWSFLLQRMGGMYRVVLWGIG